MPPTTTVYSPRATSTRNALRRWPKPSKQAAAPTPASWPTSATRGRTGGDAGPWMLGRGCSVGEVLSLRRRLFFKSRGRRSHETLPEDRVLRAEADLHHALLPTPFLQPTGLHGDPTPVEIQQEHLRFGVNAGRGPQEALHLRPT